MYDRFDYYGVADLNRELVEAEMGRAIYVGMVPKVEIKKGLSYDKLKKGDKVSFVNRQTGKKQVLTVTEKGAPTHEQIKNIFLVGRGGSSYGLHFYKGHNVPKLVRYGGKARGGMRAVPTEVRVEPGSLQIESAESFYGQSFEEACGKSHKKKQGVKWHGIKAVVKKEELESELQRLESTDSPFPEVRARRIEELKTELEEAMKYQEIGPYGEYAPAQEKAMKLQSKGAKSIRIDKGKGGWIIGFVSDKKLESAGMADELEEAKDYNAPSEMFRKMMYQAPVDLERLKRLAKKYDVKIVRERPLPSMNPELHLKEVQVHVRLPDGRYGILQPGGGPAKGLRSYSWSSSMGSNYTDAEKKKARIKESVLGEARVKSQTVSFGDLINLKRNPKANWMAIRPVGGVGVDMDVKIFPSRNDLISFLKKEANRSSHGALGRREWRALIKDKVAAHMIAYPSYQEKG